MYSYIVTDFSVMSREEKEKSLFLILLVNMWIMVSSCQFFPFFMGFIWPCLVLYKVTWYLILEIIELRLILFGLSFFHQYKRNVF